MAFVALDSGCDGFVSPDRHESVGVLFSAPLAGSTAGRREQRRIMRLDTSNRRSLVAEEGRLPRLPDPPIKVASTLLVRGVPVSGALDTVIVLLRDFTPI